jgi:hypothetical protein
MHNFGGNGVIVKDSKRHLIHNCTIGIYVTDLRRKAARNLN